MVTHDEDLTKYANKIIRVKDGVITKGKIMSAINLIKQPLLV